MLSHRKIVSLAEIEIRISAKSWDCAVGRATKPARSEVLALHSFKCRLTGAVGSWI